MSCLFIFPIAPPGVEIGSSGGQLGCPFFEDFERFFGGGAHSMQSQHSRIHFSTYIFFFILKQNVSLDLELTDSAGLGV